MIEIEVQCQECGRKFNCPTFAESKAEALMLFAKRELRCNRCGTKLSTTGEVLM